LGLMYTQFYVYGHESKTCEICGALVAADPTAEQWHKEWHYHRGERQYSPQYTRRHGWSSAMESPQESHEPS
jgi:hypothetical protein